jgi:Uma2 family endonuclease
MMQFHADCDSELKPLHAAPHGVEWRGFGSTTYKRKDLRKGFEPDACFYFKNEGRMRGKKRLNLAVDPPPDLVIEIDITRPSLNKLPLFADFGIPEVWRFDGQELEILHLRDGEYFKNTNSLALPLVTADVVSHFLHEGERTGRLAWTRKIRAWASKVKSRD